MTTATILSRHILDSYLNAQYVVKHLVILVTQSFLKEAVISTLIGYLPCVVMKPQTKSQSRVENEAARSWEAASSCEATSSCDSA